VRLGTEAYGPRVDGGWCGTDGGNQRLLVVGKRRCLLRGVVGGGGGGFVMKRGASGRAAQAKEKGEEEVQGWLGEGERA